MTTSRRDKSASSQQSKQTLTIVIAAALVIGITFLLWRPDKNKPSEDALFAPVKKQSAAAQATNSGAVTPLQKGRFTYSPNDTPDDIAQKRLDRARHTLEGYKLGTRYPPESRPLSEKPDLQKPHSVQKAYQPLATSDGKVTKARVVLQQDRLYLVGDESAKLDISCESGGAPMRCEVLSAFSTIPPTSVKGATIGPNPVPFLEGADGHALAVFAPAKEGFSSHHGDILVEAKLRIGNEEGTASFHLIYTPSAPARFTGKVREVLENGSLCLYIEMDVQKAGRYILAARVDDASNEGFAYLDFNDSIEAGLREAKMCIFGLLVLDQRAESPFTLRDLEGYFFREFQDPDRELMSVIEGKVYTTKAYEESAFSSDEWQSEERSRHIKEFENDVKKAEEEIKGGGGSGKP